MYGDASKSAYGTTISAASFALGGSENGSSFSQKKDQLLGNLASIDRRMDQLLARASSVKSKEDLAAWEREREEVKKFLAETELGLEWVRELEREGGC